MGTVHYIQGNEDLPRYEDVGPLFSVRLGGVELKAFETADEVVRFVTNRGAANYTICLGAVSGSEVEKLKEIWPWKV